MSQPRSGRHLIGQRIRVYWEGEQKWFSGTIAEYSEVEETHLVVYDDGDQRSEPLGDPALSWCEEVDSDGIEEEEDEEPEDKRPQALEHEDPQVTLKLARPPPKRPASAAPSSSKRPKVAAPVPKEKPTLWPSGGSWRPSTRDWGTRAPGAFGCGKCRWRPMGCRGCIAAAADYVTPATATKLPRGAVAIPSSRAHAHVYASDGPGEGERRESLRELSRRVAVVGGDAQSDGDGFGVVAQARLPAGTTLVDWSVFFVQRPAEYALAHLPQFHALEFGREAYFLLREPALGLGSLTYFVNEARHGGAPGPPANVAYKVVRPRGGGIALGLHCLETIEAGDELLASYDQRVA